MFDFVRNNRWIVGGILGLIILTFAFFGVESYFQSNYREPVLVRVGSSKITQREFVDTNQQQQNRLRQVLGDAYSAEKMDSLEEKRKVLDRLINRRLLQLEAQRLHLTVSVEELQEFIRSVPNFRKEDQTFDVEKYKTFISQQGMSVQRFEDTLREDLSVRKLQEGWLLSAFTPDVAVQVLNDALSEKRTYSTLTLNAGKQNVALSDEAVEAYYKEHSSEFFQPEQVKVEYLTLTPEDFLNTGKLDDAAVSKWYQDHLSQFQSAENRSARHILIGLKKNTSADEKETARKKAEEVLKEVRANPANFAELAKKYSQDPGSAKNGGDLGSFPQGAMVPTFDSKVFSMKKGEISDLVETDFGFHIIQLTGITPAVTQPLENVRPTAVAGLRRELTDTKYRDMAEQFRTLVFENYDSLKPAADKLGLTIKTGPWVSKGEAAPAGFPANASLLSQLFSKEVLEDKHNTEAVEIRPGNLMAARVVEHKPGGVRPFADVRAEARNKAKLAAGMALAKKRGAEIIEQLQAGKSLPADLKWGKSLAQTQDDKNLPKNVADALFAMTKTPSFAGLDTADGFQILRLESAARPPLEPGALAQNKNRYEQLIVGAQLLGFLEQLRKRFPVRIDEEMLSKSSAANAAVNKQ